MDAEHNHVSDGQNALGCCGKRTTIPKIKLTSSQIAGCWREFSAINNFTKGCKWSPDGSCILTCSEDRRMRIFNVPPQFWDPYQMQSLSNLESSLIIPEYDLIYDYCWHPLMNSNNRGTFCFATTSRRSSTHLWDAYTGELRSSYRSYNSVGDLMTPQSLSFDTSGKKLFCGFKGAVRIFDIENPNTFVKRIIRENNFGQSGHISCFAFTPNNENISAAGSYEKSIGLYDETSGEIEHLLTGQSNGITHLLFSPDGQRLYSGGRKDPEILCWDIRNLGMVLFALRRHCDTNQRMYFDISRCGRFVVTGNTCGRITLWDVKESPIIYNKDEFPAIEPLLCYLGHNDCVNGISFHPRYPCLCSSSGQRKYPAFLDDRYAAMVASNIANYDNSLRLWWIGKSQ